MTLVRSWRNDWRIWRWTRQNDLISDVEQQAWFDAQAKDPRIKMYRIDCTAGSERTAIGVCGFSGLDYANRRAEFSIYLAPAFQQRGLGKVALSVLLAHGFENLGLNVIWGETFDGNPAARLFEKVGLVKEGTLRSRYWKDGKWINSHIYGLTRDEWNTLRSQPLASPASTPSS